MPTETIQHALNRVREFLAANPDRTQSADSRATAVYQGGIRFEVHGPHDTTIITDMSTGIGGKGSAPAPGWYMRASLASCDATLIVMCAAEAGIRLTTLEVTIDSTSDNRGMFGLGEGIPPGVLEIRSCIRIGAENASPERLHALVDEALSRAPVSDALRREVPVVYQIELA